MRDDPHGSAPRTTSVLVTRSDVGRDGPSIIGRRELLALGVTAAGALVARRLLGQSAGTTPPTDATRTASGLVIRNARALDIPGAITTIRSILTLRARILWTELVQREAEPWQILSTLLGLLELAKMGELRVDQPKPFANVEISRDVASEAA